ncbi:MAG: amidohydrolase family protein [Sulfobacillus acidophilus]|uniref:Amidohydrolase family protein n=1 Tax=Sulfobacillus acidophilus TaxID=53633 RepID=A0A2T2WFS5_9FIRM|nr:MAG: amidohydrolase family protein [Sulfobacillus acidophilus]
MSSIYIFNGTLIDGTGRSTVSDAAVLIRDQHIVHAGPGAEVSCPRDETITKIDACGGTILPGLIDCHVHITAEIFPTADFSEPYTYRILRTAQYAQRTLDAGITSVRDAGGADRGIQWAFDRGVVPGPRTQISVTMLSITGGHGDDYAASLGYPLTNPLQVDGVCDGVDGVRKKVREVIRAGAQVIKVATSGGVISATDNPEDAHFSPQELQTIVEEARMHGGIRAMAHAQATQGIKNAVRAGFISIEHGIYLDQEAIDLMLEHETFLVPTLVAPLAVIKARDEGLTVPDYAIEKTKRVLEAHHESVARAHAAGVKIAMGTDSGVGHHGTNLEELSHLVDIGMSPMQALVASTRQAAELLGWSDRLGTLQPGKLADVVITTIDPLANIGGLANPDNISWVIKGGTIVKTKVEHQVTAQTSGQPNHRRR